MDFTLDLYAELLDAIISSGYEAIGVQEYLEGRCHDNSAIIRHDVDRQPRAALATGEIERARGIRATYYFRYAPRVYKMDIVAKLIEMGHEIGYHYEVLDRCGGDVDAALELFEEELGEMRKGCEIRTACMHGNPTKPWKNTQIFNGRFVESLGVLGEAYLSINFEDVAYFTDTGRRWDRKYSVKDHAPKNPASEISIKHTSQLIALIRNHTFANLYIVVHPNRWNNFGPRWLREYVAQNVKNVGKRILIKAGY